MKATLIAMAKAKATEQATNGVAIMGITFPWWLPDISTVSSTAAQLLPIASLMWLILQIIAWFVRKPKDKQ